MKLMEEYKKAFDNTALSSNNILLTTHIGPDDDAIGSILSVYHYLTVRLKIDSTKIRMMILGKIKGSYNYFRNYDKIISTNAMVREAEDSDMIILLDGNNWLRFMEGIPNTKAVTFILDHHPTMNGEFDHHMALPGKTSTSEIVYDMFYKNTLIEKEACEYLLCGIIGDTGLFRFIDKEKTSALLMAKDLIEQGDIEINNFMSEYSRIEWNTFNYFKKLIDNTEIRRTGEWPPYLVSYIEKGDLDMEESEMEYYLSEAKNSYKQYLIGLKNVPWGFVIVPMKDYSSISFRSMREGPNVRIICESMGIGGGHDKASGAVIETDDVLKSISMIEEWLSKNKPAY
ncbi:MAG: DHH family phosphoesterase [Candidatus Woesearchaeota archaeon]